MTPAVIDAAAIGINGSDLIEESKVFKLGTLST